MTEPNWNYMARAMQRAPFFAKGSEEDIEAALRIASEIPEFVEGCGCVFCDLDLEPMLHEGKMMHQIEGGQSVMDGFTWAPCHKPVNQK